MSVPLVEPLGLTSFAPPAATELRDTETPNAQPHSLPRRVIERFALIAFGLYHVPLLLNNYPSLGGGGMNDNGLAIAWGHVFTPPGIWVARHILRAAGPMPYGNQGDNGDVAEEFGRLLIAVAIGIVGAICWTLADRKRPRGRWTGDGLRVLLRYSIALGLASYAIAKILPMQFPPINPVTLEQRVGDLTPMSLLWTFMEYSRPYAFFAGLMELVVVVLLCFRRTTTLGAVLCIVVMTNVALMNYGYGVPVKLYATMTVISAVVLVLYDSRRLFALFVGNRTAVPAYLESPQDRIPTSIRWPIKFVLVGSVLLSSVVAMQSILRAPRATSPVEGTWAVTSFAVRAPITDSLQWRRVLVQGSMLTVRLASDEFMRCQTATTPQRAGSIALTCSHNRKGVVRWMRTGDSLQFEGVFDGNPVSFAGRLVPASEYRLNQGKFRWMIG